MLNSELWQAPLAGGDDFYTHQISQSARFIRTGDNANTYLKRTPSSAGNRKTYTLSLWVKRVQTTSLETFASAQVTSTTNYVDGFKFGTAQYDNSGLSLAAKGTVSGSLITTASYRDTSAWMHIVIRVDSTQGTAANRFRLYVNGEQVTAFGTETYIAEDYEGGFCSTREHAIGWGTGANNGQGFFGYMAEVILADGTSYAPTQFGESKNGVWIPKDPSGTSFGTTGFHLDFADASALGNDVSGNNNDFTNVGMQAHDQMLDSPTFGGSNGGNFATIGPLWKTSDMTFSEGNLKWTCSTNQRGLMSNWAVPIGTKAYWEYIPVTFGGNTSNGDESWIGINQGIAALVGGDRGGKETAYAYGTSNGYKTILNSASSYGATIRANDVVGVAVDRVNHTINFSKNNSWQGTFAISATMDLFPFIGSGGGSSSATGTFNFGQDGTFAGTKTAGGNADENGYGNFLYTPPSGFLAMCSGNLPVTDAIDPAQTDDDYPQKLFNAVAYTGNGSSGRTLAIDMAKKPSISMNKRRSGDTVAINTWTAAFNSGDYDSFGELHSDADWYVDQGSDGPFSADPTASTLTYTAYGQVNAGSAPYISWNWVANGGSTSSNTNGSLTSTVEVDPSGCFSVGKYTGNATNSTIGHGLSKVPSFILIKKMTGQDRKWTAWHTSLSNTQGFFSFNTNSATQTDSGIWQNTAPTSSVFSVNYGTTEVNAASGHTYLFWAFANCEGWIKAGKYIGNADADGAFVYTGFKPAWIFLRAVDSGDDPQIYDNARDTFNPATKVIPTHSTAAETDNSNRSVDFLSNGFKFRTSNSNVNGSDSDGYLYLAMAHNPFKYATAR